MSEGVARNPRQLSQSGKGPRSRRKRTDQEGVHALFLALEFNPELVHLTYKVVELVLGDASARAREETLSLLFREGRDPPDEEEHGCVEARHRINVRGRNKERHVKEFFTHTLHTP